MVGPAEIARRINGRRTGRLESLPILALTVHSACNCRCVMCDIWKANADKREISAGDLERHIAAIRSLRVQRVMLTGGETAAASQPVGALQSIAGAPHSHHAGHHRTVDRVHAADIASTIDTVVISLTAIATRTTPFGA
jgi:organic radical activating enzyme